MSDPATVLASESEQPAEWPSAWSLWSALSGSKKASRLAKFGISLLIVGFFFPLTERYGVSEAVSDFVNFVCTLVGFALYYLSVWKHIQEELDELHRRIALEAIAFAFFGVMTLVATSGTLENIVHAKGPNDAWVFLVAEALRGIGIAVAVRKYR